MPDAVVTSGGWGSTGSVLGDLAKIATSPRSILDRIGPQYDQWVAGVPEGRPAIVLGHSFGCVVAHKLVSQGAPPGTTLIGLGSPAHHPLMSMIIPDQTAVRIKAVAVVNPDDDVSAWRRRYRHLAGWTTLPIEFARTKGDIVHAIEHDPRSYLMHHSVQRRLRLAS